MLVSGDLACPVVGCEVMRAGGFASQRYGGGEGMQSAGGLLAFC